MEIICFHRPEEENGYLSNWYMSDFVVDGVEFSSLEQYMMFKKAKFFNDEHIVDCIMKPMIPAKSRIWEGKFQILTIMSGMV